MIRKIAAFLLCFMLAFSLGVSAENAQNDLSAENQAAQAPSEQQGDMPMREGRGGRMGGGRPGGMGVPPAGEMPQGEGMQPPQMPAEGNGEVMPPQMPANESGEPVQPPELPGETTGGETAQQPQSREDMPEQPQGGEFQGSMVPGDDMNSFLNNGETQTNENAFLSFVKTYSTPIISVIMLALAFVFVIFYKRKKY